MEPKQIFKDFFKKLQTDLAAKGSFWTPTLTSYQEEPSARVLVLRKVPKEDHFILHTDTRSAKWATLKVHPSACLHFYCPKEKWQMRIQGQVRLNRDDERAREEWQDLRESSQEIYRLSHPPGTVVKNPEEGFNKSSWPQEGFENFGVINFHALSMDSLILSEKEGEPLHIRAFWDLKKHDFSYLSP